ncbi:Transcription cofactor vestigial-like protein 2 [Camelus dromedarius]|uniref:Transcription cofactor vestigial-like protein 2 n=1 Tax=Camelus dromedarius TaxID=9838 RepID=A0A5N4DVY0_CAMDR|nr:Transcription cofactor vestigial-like protein 2 [Camelus dromedarius]
MSCLDVMYQVYGPPQPYFAAAYTPYHQKLAYYSKMQEAQECNASPSNSSGSGSSSFSSQTPANIKEEEGSPEKERPPEAEYINSRCVLFTYFQGDISSVVDEHFSRALSQPSSYSPSCTSSKAPRSSGPWRGEYGAPPAKEDREPSQPGVHLQGLKEMP